MKNTVMKGNIYIVLSAFFFGSYGIWSRLMGQAFGDFFQAWTRSLLIVAIIVPIGLYFQAFKMIKREDWAWYALVSLAGALTFATYFYAFNHLSVGTATLLFYAALTFGNYLLGKFFFSEDLTLAKMCA